MMRFAIIGHRRMKEFVLSLPFTERFIEFNFTEFPIWITGALFLLLFLGTFIIIVWFIVRIPSNYFKGPEPPSDYLLRRPLFVRIIVSLVRNLIGLLLLVVGVMMLVLPGQGVLTIIISIMIMDIPGKYRLEQRLVLNDGVFQILNRLRSKYGCEPLLRPAEH